jgi:hypothetical protein
MAPPEDVGRRALAMALKRERELARDEAPKYEDEADLRKRGRGRRAQGAKRRDEQDVAGDVGEHHERDQQGLGAWEARRCSSPLKGM